MRHRRVATIATVALAGTVMAGCSGMDRLGTAPTPDCTVASDGHVVELEFAQAANAATITAVGVGRGLPPRAMIVALATAWQESKLHNIDYGDRDSLGLFQQRPSQGWGSEEEILDPRYAATAFYEHLERVPEWESMRVTDAAQTVQRSAFPEEYEQWADDSAAMVDAFTGVTPKALRCVQVERPGEGVSTSDLGRALSLDWGESAEYVEIDGGIAVSVSSVEDGWRYASWLVAHSTERGIATVEFDGRRWHAESGEWETPEAAGDDATVIATVH